MDSGPNIIDFLELQGPIPGEKLEHLVRLLVKSLGMVAWSSGRGPDGGKDLIVREPLQSSVREWTRVWVVSCKDFCKSGGAVKEDDLPKVLEKVKQYKADGFLLVTTTVASAAAAEQLRALDRSEGGDIFTAVWDNTDLTALLITPERRDILQQFFQDSYRNITGMTTLEGAINAHRNELPDEVYNSLISLVRPTDNRQLTGATMWPSDIKVAQQLDTILASWRPDHNIEETALTCLDLPIDVLLTLLYDLAAENNNEVFGLSIELIKVGQDVNTIINVFEFILDNYELNNETIEVANRLPVEELKRLLSETFSQHIEEELAANSGNHSIYSTINELGMSANVNDVQVGDIDFQPEADLCGSFSGTMLVGVNYYFDLDDPPGYMVFPGTFIGTFDSEGISLTQVGIDTDSFYEQ